MTPYGIPKLLADCGMMWEEKKMKDEEESLILLKKSEENKIVAEEAFVKGYYHIYVSRIYYSLYQKLIYLSHTNIDSLPFTMSISSGGKHQDFIQKMAAYFYSKNKKELSFKLNTNMQKICRVRNESDYGSEELTDKKKANQVKALYAKIVSDLEKEIGS